MIGRGKRTTTYSNEHSQQTRAIKWYVGFVSAISVTINILWFMYGVGSSIGTGQEKILNKVESSDERLIRLEAWAKEWRDSSDAEHKTFARNDARHDSLLAVTVGSVRKIIIKQGNKRWETSSTTR